MSFFEKQKTFFNPQGGVTPSFRIYIGKDLLAPHPGGPKSFPPSIPLRVLGDGYRGALVAPYRPPSPLAPLGVVLLRGGPRGVPGRGGFFHFFPTFCFFSTDSV